MIAVPDIIIAVDGWSSTGKSTFAKLVAKHFGFLYLDSGAMYRGVTLLAMEKGLIGPEGIDEPGLKKALDAGFDLHFERPGDGSTRLYSGERDIEKRSARRRCLPMSAPFRPWLSCAVGWMSACMLSA